MKLDAKNTSTIMKMSHAKILARPGLPEARRLPSFSRTYYFGKTLVISWQDIAQMRAHLLIPRSGNKCATGSKSGN